MIVGGVIVLAAILSSFPLQTRADVVRQIPFSARLKTTETETTAPDGNYQVTFGIYTSDSGGTAVWSETQTLTTKGGLLTANLGSVTALPSTLNFNDDAYYLGIKIGSDAEMTPRKRITAVPLALNAESVAGAKPGTGANNILKLDSSGNINIAGNIATTGTLQAGSSTLSTLTVDTNTLAVDAANNRVGIGITTPSYPLDVVGDINTSTQLRIGGNVVCTSAGCTGSGGAASFVQGGNSFGGLATLGTNDSNALAFETSATEQMRIASDGKVGIGTTNPNLYKLHVEGSANDITSGSIRVSNPTDGTAAASVVNFQSGTSNSASGYFGAFSNSYTASPALADRIALATNSDASGIVLYSSDPGQDIRFFAGGTTERARFDGTNGYLGLGTTDPQNALHIRASAPSIRFEGTTLPSNIWHIGRFSSSNLFSIAETGVADRLVVEGGTGEVGIGTSSPSQKLHVIGNILANSNPGYIAVGDGNPYVNMFFDGTTGIAGFGNNLYHNGTNWVYASTTGYSGKGLAWHMNPSSGVNLKYAANGANPATTSDIFTILTSGNVGIGDTSPASLLTVGSGDLFQVNSSGAIAAVTGITTSGGYSQSGSGANTFSGASSFTAAGTALSVTNNASIGGTINSNTFTSTALTFAGASPAISASTAGTNILLDAGTTGAVNIAGTSTGDINLGGGSGSTGCTLTNSSGNFTCTGNITGSGSGTMGYWARSGTSLSPATIGDTVGIGTASPATQLEVRNGTAGFWGQSANAWGASPTTTPAQALTITSSASGGYDPVLLFRQATSTGTIKTSGAIDMLGRGAWTDGTVSTQISDMLFILRDNADTLQERMRITSGGNVGIGVTPSFKLHVSGVITGDGNSDLPAGAGSRIYWAGGYNSPDAGRFIFGDQTGWKMHFGTRSSSTTTDLVTIQDNGNVGIGTASPSGKLHVFSSSLTDLVTTSSGNLDIGFKGGAGGWARAFRVVNSSGSNGQDGGAFGVNGSGTTPNYMYMAIPTSDATGFDSTKILALNNSGNVGIGTTAQTALLHLLGVQPASQAGNGTNATAVLTATGGKGGNTSGTTGQLAGAGATLTLTSGAGGDAPSGSTNGNGGLVTIQGGAAGAGAGTAGSRGNIALQTSGGNVGIGTSSPNAILDVEGTSGTDNKGAVRIVGSNLQTGLSFMNTNASYANPFTASNADGFGGDTLDADFYGGLHGYNATGGGFGVVGTSNSATVPGLALEANKGVESTTQPAIRLNAVGSNGSTGRQAIGNANQVLGLFNNGTQLITVLGSGNVGIGTSSPATPLDVKNTATNEQFHVTNNTQYLYAGANSSDYVTLGGFKTGTGAIPLILQSAGGNVGIGVTSGINSKLTFAADTVAAGGILFGTDTNLYRSAADILRTDDSLNIGARLITAQGANQAPGAAGTVTPSESFIALAPAAAVTLSATTAISDGTASGQQLILKGTSDTNTVQINDNANTQLGGGVNRVLGANDMIGLLWDGTDWIELYFTNN